MRVTRTQQGGVAILAITGAMIEETAAMVFYLEQGAKTELAVLACGGHPDADGGPERPVFVEGPKLGSLEWNFGQ